MKNKNIRKEKTKKKQPTSNGSVKSLHVSAGGTKYCITYDNYSATITRADTDEAIAVYRAADRNWKVFPGFLSYSIQTIVESLYL